MIGFLCLVPSFIVTAILALAIYHFDRPLWPWALGGFAIPIALAVTMLLLDARLPQMAGNEADNAAVEGRIFLVPAVGQFFLWLWLVFWIILLFRFGLDLNGIALPTL